MNDFVSNTLAPAIAPYKMYLYLFLAGVVSVLVVAGWYYVYSLNRTISKKEAENVALQVKVGEKTAYESRLNNTIASLEGNITKMKVAFDANVDYFNAQRKKKDEEFAKEKAYILSHRPTTVIVDCNTTEGMSKASDALTAAKYLFEE